MSFTIMDLFVIGGFCLSVLTFSFGIAKFFNTTTHKRIDEVKKDLTKELDESKKNCDEELKDIRNNYVHKDNINSTMEQIKNIVDDVKKEQHRMSQRFDDLLKWIMTSNKGHSNGA